MCSAQDNVALPTLGFPIRASAGHWPFSASPRLIAAVHALHRLLVPRHPPCALTILTDGDRGISQSEIPWENLAILPIEEIVHFFKVKSRQAFHPDTRFIGYCAVFKVRKEAYPPLRCPLDTSPSERPATSRSLKAQQHVATLELPLGQIRDFSRLTRYESLSRENRRFSQCNGALRHCTGSVDISSGRAW